MCSKRSTTTTYFKRQNIKGDGGSQGHPEIGNRQVQDGETVGPGDQDPKLPQPPKHS
jgi:hypothetical protein